MTGREARGFFAESSERPLHAGEYATVSDRYVRCARNRHNVHT